MGFADRPYARTRYASTSTVGAMRMWSVTTWLIAVNVAVYVLNLLSDGTIGQWGAFTIGQVVYGLQLWRFISFQFLHASASHIFFNMLSLYFFGPMIEGYLGPRRYLAFYLLCGMSGGLLFLIFWRLSVLQLTPDASLVGASAGIFGVLIAAARIAPNTTVMLMFPPIPMRLKTLAYIMLGIAVLTVFDNGHNAGGEAAHLGGAALGAALIARPQVLDVFDRLSFGMKKGRKFRDDWQ
jgi:membrane associated rhomboid family serine protease